MIPALMVSSGIKTRIDGWETIIIAINGPCFILTVKPVRLPECSWSGRKQINTCILQDRDSGSVIRNILNMPVVKICFQRIH
jgi:hypothetical protein